MEMHLSLNYDYQQNLAEGLDRKHILAQENHAEIKS